MGPSKTTNLTCYRRNLFNVYGVVLIPQNFVPFVNKDGERKKITGLSAQLMALESLDGRSVKIVTIPSRRASTGEAVPTYIDHKPVTLDADLDTDRFSSSKTFPISWNRLQFRNATAKNHRRGSVQQVYRLHVVVLAMLEDASQVTIATAVSFPIVVRGSSPGSFQPRKDAILRSGLASTATESQYLGPRIEENPQIQTPAPGLPGCDPYFESQETRNTNIHDGQVNITHGSTSDVSFDPQHESYWTSPAMHVDSMQLDMSGTRATQTAMPDISSPELSTTKDTTDDVTEDSTLIYEYYPLSIDDWTVPIEAIYVSASKLSNYQSTAFNHSTETTLYTSARGDHRSCNN